MNEEEYKELIYLSNELVEYLDHATTHISRFTILIAKFNQFIRRITFQPQETEEEFRTLLVQLGETILLLGNDITEIGINGKQQAEKLMEIVEK